MICKTPAIVAAVAAALLATDAKATVLSNGNLSVTINTESGVIDPAVYAGLDFFNPGTPVSGFGFQNGSDTSTFARNRVGVASGLGVTVAGPVVTGTYTGGGAAVRYQRRYELVPGFDALRITTDFTNVGDDVTISYFDTYDPDQQFDINEVYETYNDVFDVPGGRAGRARSDSGATVMIGTADGRGTIAAGGPFEIETGSALNAFLAAPVDGEDTYEDQGMHIGLQAFLAAGESDSFSYIMAFGETPAAAEATLTALIPEPTSLGLAGLATAMLAGVRRRFDA